MPPVDPAVSFQAAHSSVGLAKRAIDTARPKAVRAATSALQAAAREAFCKAAKGKATRRRGAAVGIPRDENPARAPLQDVTNRALAADA